MDGREGLPAIGRALGRMAGILGFPGACESRSDVREGLALVACGLGAWAVATAMAAAKAAGLW